MQFFRKINFWQLTTLIVLAIYFGRAFEPAASGDTYWHLAIGRQVWQEKAIPTFDKFVYGSVNPQFTSTEWLAGLIFYGMVSNFGLSGLVVLRAVLGSATVYFLYLTVKLISQNELLASLVTVGVGYLLALRFQDRPEIFSLLFLAIVNYVFLYYWLKKKISLLAFGLPLIFLLWPNTHGFAILGLAIVVFWQGQLTVEHIRRQHWGEFWRLAILSFLAILAAVIQWPRTFYFLKVASVATFDIPELWTLSDRLFRISYDFFREVSIEIYVYLIFLVGYAALFIYWLINFKKAQVGLKLFTLAFLLIPWKFFRLISLTLLVVIPYLILLMVNWPIWSKQNYQRPVLRASLAIVMILLIGSILTGGIVGSRQDRFYAIDERGKIAGVTNRTWVPTFPEKAAAVVANYLETERLFTGLMWNSYFIWQLPEIRVFSDAMFEYRTREDHADEVNLVLGRGNWQELLDRYDIDTVVVNSHSYPAHNQTPVFNLANWRLIFVDEVAALYAREEVIREQPVNLSAIKMGIAGPLKFRAEDEKQAIEQLQNLLKFDPVNGFARAQLVQHYLNLQDLKEAKILAQESRKLIPTDPIFSLYLAAVAATVGDCQAARNFSREAKTKGFGHPRVSQVSAEILARCQ